MEPELPAVDPNEAFAAITERADQITRRLRQLTNALERASERAGMVDGSPRAQRRAQARVDAVAASQRPEVERLRAELGELERRRAAAIEARGR